jgi:hypothetical protein
VLARCEGIDIVFLRQQEFQEAYVSDAAGLINAKQYQMLGNPRPSPRLRLPDDGTKRRR